MNTIILATDGSLHSDAAARFLVESPLLNRDFVVHVVHCEPDVAGDVKSFIGKADIDAWHHEESCKAMQSVVGILTAANVGHECHELVGFTPEKIVEYAKQIDAGAIVIGSHHHSPLINAIRGSVSGRILAHSPCPVMLV